MRTPARIPFVAAVVTLIVAPRSLRADPPTTPPPTLPIVHYTLPNGLEVVLHEDHRTPTVSLNVWYHVGSKDEPAGRNGFAHLFEHLMFQGSRHVPEDTFFLQLERAGASGINGSTTSDRTNYFETVPTGRLDLALWLESDRMAYLLDHVDEATFESQRRVVLNERRQNYENAPYGNVYFGLHAALFPDDHPYHLATIGSPEDLNRATLDDVRAFFRTWYSPDNATLVVAGDIRPDDARERIARWFGPIARGPIAHPRPVVRPVVPAGETRLEYEAGVQLPRVYASWVTPPTFAPGDAELDLLAAVLSRGRTSRLYRRMVYELQIAQDVSASQGLGQLASIFAITATAREGHTADELLRVIDEELARLRETPPTDEELTRARIAIRSASVFGLERLATRADALNTYAHYAGDPDYLARDFARYDHVMPDALREVARTLLPASARVVAMVTPVAGAPLAGRLRTTGGSR